MNPALPLPKYHQVYLVLREQLGEGRFADGLPGELALMQAFSVSRVTVRRALEQLAAEGLIAREAGRGTRPIPPRERSGAGASTPSTGDAERLTGLLENLVSVSRGTRIRVLEVGVVSASEPVAQALQIAAGDPVQKAVRVRSTDEGPLSHITTWVPQALAAGFGERELADKPTL